MNRSPKKMKRERPSENENYTYDDVDIYNPIDLREADVSELPPHLFKNLIKIKCSAGTGEELTAEELESAANGDGEIWLIQCPKNVNPSAVFSGTKLSLEDDNISVLNTLSDDEEFDIQNIVKKSKNPGPKRKATYEALSLPNKNANGIVAVVPDSEGNRRVVATSLSGSIIVRESLFDMPIIKQEPRRKGIKELPPGLKEHHPVYGVDFSFAKDMDNNTNSDDENFTKKSHKKRKSASDYFSSQNHKMTKESEDKLCNGSSSYSENYKSDDFSDNSKRKKKKKSKTERFELEVQDELYVNQTEYPTVSKVNNVPEEEELVKKKKSKKRKKEEEESSQEEYNDNDQNNPIEATSPSKKKKRKKDKETDYSIEEYNRESNYEEMSPPKTKKRKKEIVEEYEYSAEPDSEETFLQKTKKHKKKKSKHKDSD